LAHAEALLNGREPVAALASAGEAAALASVGGLVESEWRAWSLAALAARGMGDQAQAQKHAVAARAAFDRLPQAIGPGEFNTWLTRPDIRRMRTQFAKGDTR
jgi:hypothetical protein